MQVLDERKREQILSVASRLFSERPFHKVLLSDVAEAAGVGKGTVYLYFKDKEDLYLSIVLDGMVRVIDRLRERLASPGSPHDDLRETIDAMVGFAFQNPRVFELLRSVAGLDMRAHERLTENRLKLFELIRAVIERGIAQGVFRDPHPELTARFIPGMIRGALQDGGEGIGPHMLSEQIHRFILAGLSNPAPNEQP